jgi:uncharacterized protein YbjT (DUF2867 family)
MSNITAIVIGATGATGKQLVTQLLDNSTVTIVKAFVRKEMTFTHPKLQVFVVDFSAIVTWQHLVTGNILFSVMGTTLKQAGSKAEQYKVDVTYQYQVAKAAATNSVAMAVLLSSYGANASSSIFYSKIKGELEALFIALPFLHLHIFQPGILERFANDGRIFENIGVTTIKWLNAVGLFCSQAPMPVAVLANKMIKVALNEKVDKLTFYRLNAIFSI